MLAAYGQGEDIDAACASGDAQRSSSRWGGEAECMKGEKSRSGLLAIRYMDNSDLVIIAFHNGNEGTKETRCKLRTRSISDGRK